MSDVLRGALIGALVGLPFGALASVLAWWIVFHGFRPHLVWVDAVDLMRRPGAQPPVEYSVEFRNAGRRAGIEVHTHARLRIQGLVADRPERWIVLEIPTNNQMIPRALPFKDSNKHYLLVLQPKAIRAVDLDRLPEGVTEKIVVGDMGLRDLLRLGTAADLTLAAVCSDAFSGARHAFLSRPLGLDDFADARERIK